DSLAARDLPGSEIESRLEDCLIRLRERYLRNLKRQQQEALALEAETGDRTAVLSKLLEQGTAIDEELAKIFAKRANPLVRRKHEKN
ncbi:MAG: hypothetical protein PHU23_06990, partial [Dehalococcoidales bacterium]|nr:hypothetical protein [Dehalococcoidales bacterium]